jgi:DNA-binding NarL/FixJ family response regulator
MADISRIAILEDDLDLCAHLTAVISAEDGLEIAFLAHSVAAARAQSVIKAFDLCLVDLDLPDGSGADFVAHVRSSRDAKCLILTVLGDRQSVVSALRSGADGYLLKDIADDQLCLSIKQTLAGQTPISPQAARFLLQLVDVHSAKNNRSPAKEPVLTAREVEIVTMFSRGLSYRETADVLSISTHTVGDHVKAIHRKLHVHSKTEAVFEALNLGLIEPLS